MLNLLRDRGEAAGHAADLTQRGFDTFADFASQG